MSMPHAFYRERTATQDELWVPFVGQVPRVGEIVNFFESDREYKVVEVRWFCGMEYQQKPLSVDAEYPQLEARVQIVWLPRVKIVTEE